MHYTRCRTCGKYIEAPSATGGVYCSDTCATSFSRCTNCGRFFPAGRGHDGEFCSRDCSIRYEMHRFHRALPAGGPAEEAT